MQQVSLDVIPPRGRRVCNQTRVGMTLLNDMIFLVSFLVVILAPKKEDSPSPQTTPLSPFPSPPKSPRINPPPSLFSITIDPPTHLLGRLLTFPRPWQEQKKHLNRPQRFLSPHLIQQFDELWLHSSNAWFSGIIPYLFRMIVAFIGYDSPFGQMSFWELQLLLILSFFTIFNRMGLWRTFCLQSNIEEALYSTFSAPMCSLWFTTKSEIPISQWFYMKISSISF